MYSNRVPQERDHSNRRERSLSISEHKANYLIVIVLRSFVFCCSRKEQNEFIPVVAVQRKLPSMRHSRPFKHNHLTGFQENLLFSALMVNQCKRPFFIDFLSYLLKKVFFLYVLTLIYKKIQINIGR